MQIIHLIFPLFASALAETSVPKPLDLLSHDLPPAVPWIKHSNEVRTSEGADIRRRDQANPVWWYTPYADPNNSRPVCAKNTSPTANWGYTIGPGVEAPLWHDCLALGLMVVQQRGVYTARNFVNTNEPLNILSNGTCIFGIHPSGNGTGNANDMYSIGTSDIVDILNLALGVSAALSNATGMPPADARFMMAGTRMCLFDANTSRNITWQVYAAGSRSKLHHE